ncbi:methyl-accepting chemotaxis protein [Actinoplanes lutulentus]|uniref:Methyl-accepting chemotaxis protein n=1 Tax=Actinoplanes lutulentus TaxID=1287878 RepID=A0A327Z931_9ACTN|nr:methyl-accepting chemotaxis protein [Actinoplanes lutulentus]MBB2942360.1 methyl-accepting chemotaxis protein [Actinoplanes lutulentus]RAK33130.1 methyl-accepting chemotaxis protein [Actinoplanes lutulentus]
MPTLLQQQVRGDVVAGALAPVVSYCDVIDGHLHDVIDQTGEAARAIVEQLGEVDSLADVITGDAERLAGMLHRALGELESVRHTRRDQQIRTLVEQMRELNQLVTGIEETSRVTNTLALATMVSAVRAGFPAIDFSAVADEVRELARQSAEAARGVGSGIADITARLDSILADDQAGKGRFEALTETLEDAVIAARQVQRDSGALTVETAGAVGHAQFQDISRQMLEHVAGAVGDVCRQAEDVTAYTRGDLAEGELRARAIKVEDLRAKHVMSRQRSTHAQQTGQEAQSATEPLIELF